MTSNGQIRVAIVGSGMAGLVTAYLLHRDTSARYIVTVFESVSELHPLQNLAHPITFGSNTECV